LPQQPLFASRALPVNFSPLRSTIPLRPISPPKAPTTQDE
jgi:hypothetical protein